MKKVLIFHPTIAPYRVDFFNAMSSRFDVRICLEYDNLKDQHFDNYRAILDKCTFTPVYLRPSFEVGKKTFYKDIISNIKSFDPDIVIGVEFGQAVCAALSYRKISKKNYSVVTMCDDSINMVSADNDFTRAHKLLRNRVVPRLDNIILTTPEVVGWYRDKFGKGICFPIIADEKVALKEYEEALPTSREYVERYRLQGKSLFLFVGRLVPIKRVDDVIRAFKAADMADSMLVIVGSGECEASLKAAAGDDVRILFTGRLEGTALKAWYNIATTFVLASEQEPFGAVTNEALLGGSDVIVSSNCGSSSLVEESVNGHIFPAGNVDALCECMKRYSGRAVPENVILRKSRMREGFGPLFDKFASELNETVRKRVLFAFPFPPPVHGSTVVSQRIRESEAVNGSFDCTFVNISTSRKISEISSGNLFVQFKKGFLFLKAFFTLLRRLASFNPELCCLAITCYGKGFLKDAPFVLLCKIFRKKVLIYQHNRGMSAYVDKALYRKLYNLAYRDSKVILLSERLYQDIEKVVPGESVRICPNGIPASPVNVDMKRSGEVPNILFLSNLLEDKGVFDLLDALKILRDRGVAFHCDFVGDESSQIDKSRFEREVALRDLNEFVTFNGPKSAAEKERCFWNADIFTLPSKRECFPLVVLEAMQHHLPVVATDEGGIGDMVIDGESGLLVAKSDVTDLALALEKLLSDESLRMRMGEAGYSRYEKQFTQQRFEDNLIDILNESI